MSDNSGVSMEAFLSRVVLAATAVAGMRLAWRSWRGVCSGSRDRIKVLVLTGPTAVGKSRLAVELCTEVGGEIVSADSVQVYKGLNIGSNKPDAATRAAVRHHLVDAGEARDPWTAGRWTRSAVAAIQDIAARDATPVVVGGTMMYVRWLTRGAPDAPAASAEVVAEAEAAVAEFRRSGRWAEALKLLAARSARGAKRATELSANDWYRLSRALEIELSEPPVTERELFLADGVRFDARCFFLAPGDRVSLFRDIDARCETMIEEGLLTEVAGLVENDALPSTSMAARAIGYRQSLAYFEERLAGREDSVECYLDFCRDFATASRNYAGDQIKWYRRDEDFAVLPAGRGAAAALLEAFRLPRVDYEAWLQGPDQRALRAGLVPDQRKMRRYAYSPAAAADLDVRRRQLAVADAALERVRRRRVPEAPLRPSIFSEADATNRLQALRRGLS